jgi:hypothetical protein
MEFLEKGIGSARGLRCLSRGTGRPLRGAALRNFELLVMSRPEGSTVVEALFLLGLTPLVRETLGDAVKIASRRQFDAVVVELEHCHEDAMELLLNLRDVAPDIPAILVGDLSGDEMGDLIRSLGNATFLKDLPDVKAFAPILEAVLCALHNRAAIGGKEEA